MKSAAVAIVQSSIALGPAFPYAEKESPEARSTGAAICTSSVFVTDEAAGLV
jgi:hypothetical protein